MNPRPRPHAFLLVLVLALAVLAGLPAAAEVRNVTFEVHPGAPTWQEEVSITVRGEANCSVFGATGEVSEIVGLGPVLRIRLDQACIIDPPSFQPFEVTVAFGRLLPAEYTVRVTLLGEEEPVLAETTLTVHLTADLEIALPATPPTDAAPFVISVSGLTGACLAPDPAEVEARVITLFFPDDCPVLSPFGGIQTFDYVVGPLAAGDYEIRVFRHQFEAEVAKATVHVFDHELCLPESDVLCLNQDRFAVRVQWADFHGGSGVGQAVPFRDDTGLFWFFHPENVELTVKVLEGCPLNGFFWVFIASGSTVEYEVSVTDTTRDETAIYRNALGQVPLLIPDTAAFACQ
jgi:hypothetical protein